MHPITLLLLGPVCLLLVILVAFLPYGSFRLASRNGMVGSERSGRRTRREVRHGRRFLRNAVFLPLLLVVLIQGTLFGLHYFIVPDTTLSDIFGENHPDVALNAPDLESWNEAIERSRKSRDYEAWQRAEGIARQSTPSIGAVMVEHWPLHLVFVMLPLAFIAWFMAQHFFAMSRHYHFDVARRAKRYALHSAATDTRAARHSKHYASPPGMLNENFG